jgi:hypothetical protein
VYRYIDHFVKVNILAFSAKLRQNPFFNDFRKIYWAVFLFTHTLPPPLTYLRLQLVPYKLQHEVRTG